ncbi:hypothetical protein ABZ907_15650 [Nonomuraea wenchangensis]
MGSLAAVGLAVLRAHAPRHVSTATTVALNRCAAVVDHLLPAAEPEYVEQYCELLREAFGPVLSPEAMLKLAAEVVEADPHDGAIRTLAEQGREAHRPGERLLHVTGIRQRTARRPSSCRGRPGVWPRRRLCHLIRRELGAHHLASAGSLHR